MNPFLLQMLLEELLKRRQRPPAEGPAAFPEGVPSGRMLPIPPGSGPHDLGAFGIDPFGSFQYASAAPPIVQGPLTNFLPNFSPSAKFSRVSTGSLAATRTPLAFGGGLGGF